MKHNGGIITEQNEFVTYHYGICRCGWKTARVYDDEGDAFHELAGHLHSVAGLPEPSESERIEMELGENPRREP